MVLDRAKSKMNSSSTQINKVKEKLEALKVEFVLFQYVDINGTPRAKIAPLSHFPDLASEGAGFAGFAVPGMGQGPHEPDLRAIPDLSSLTILPWRKNIARFASNIYVEGKAWEYCSRTILANVLLQARQEGFIYHTGVEAELFLVKRNERGGIEPYDPLDTQEKPCYDLKGLTRSMDILLDIVRNVNELGWDVEATDHEDANSQFEINIKFDESMATADKLVFYRFMVSTLANNHGVIATFMPKPFANRTGSGSHFHMNLVDAKTRRNLFLDLKDKNGLGLSRTAYHFMGGLLKHARAYAALTAPTVNSYKRLVVGRSISGATWAPAYVTYGGNNRTQMLRIPAPGRVEDRTIDSSCNPYLATAATLASGLDGVKNETEPGARNDGNMYELTTEQLKNAGIKLLPSTLNEALDELNEDEVIRKALGERFIDYYISLKRDEWSDYHRSVSQWEIDRYLTLI
jgi:glutamine synthetase